MTANVKTLLFISSADKVYSHCFLFHCAKYWAEKGNKVLYITHQPMDTLPYSVGIPRKTENLESFKLIQFVYLPKWQDLLKHCYSLHFQQSPVSVIIVQELENYSANDQDCSHDHVSLICASLLQAASICALKNSKPSYLISGFNSKNSVLPCTISKNFFHNIWQLNTESEETESARQKKLIRLTNLSDSAKLNNIKLFAFYENHEHSILEFDSAFKTIFRN